MTKIHALLIAAGESRRMGSPKQLLPWGRQTLIEHQIQTLLKANISVSVVLGSNSELIRNSIEHLNIQNIHNEHWKTGMASSIACGAKALDSIQMSYDGILITLVDQPLIPTVHFQMMMDQFETGKKQIIVSKSDKGITGPPVLFDMAYFDELKLLKGNDGAKPIVKKYMERVILMTSGYHLDDMDTPEVYKHLLALANLRS